MSSYTHSSASPAPSLRDLQKQRSLPGTCPLRQPVASGNLSNKAHVFGTPLQAFSFFLPSENKWCSTNKCNEQTVPCFLLCRTATKLLESWQNQKVFIITFLKLWNRNASLHVVTSEQTAISLLLNYLKRVGFLPIQTWFWKCGYIFISD